MSWFSDRGGNSDIYVTSTRNGTEWSGPARVTTSAHGDFYPSLFQDDQGTFHLIWFRWEAPFRGHIWHNRSADGRTWDPSTEEQATVGMDVDDWVPTLTQAADRTLLVYFVSQKRDAANPTNEIYVVAKRPGGSWEPAVPVTALNSATEHDHLPFAARAGGAITLVWVRHDQTEPLPWLNPRSDLFTSSSADGRSWSAPIRITDDAGYVVHLFPALYPRLEGAWSLLWLSTRLGSPKVFELPLASSGSYPQGISENTQLRAGYSHRIIATSSLGIYLAVWVEGPEGAQDIYYRFFAR